MNRLLREMKRNKMHDRKIFQEPLLGVSEVKRTRAIAKSEEIMGSEARAGTHEISSGGAERRSRRRGHYKDKGFLLKLASEMDWTIDDETVSGGRERQRNETSG